MRYLFCLAGARILSASMLAADCLQAASDADMMHNQGRYADAKAILLEAVQMASGKEATELYWRASRETLELGDKASKEKMPAKQVVGYFNEGGIRRQSHSGRSRL